MTSTSQRAAADQRADGSTRRSAPSPLAWSANSVWLIPVGGLLVLATAILLWLGYRATEAQARSDRLLADRRAGETLALLVAALDRDMKGAQLSLLLHLSENQLLTVGAADLASQASTAFGRFPYLETIFVWRDFGAP